MKAKALKNIFDSLKGSLAKEQIEFFKKLTSSVKPENIRSLDSFHWQLLKPHRDFIAGLIQAEISENKDVEFIFQNYQYLIAHFEYWINKHEGHVCCADKADSILTSLAVFYRTRKPLAWPTESKVFKDHETAVSFYEAVKSLHFGRPDKYFAAVREIIERLGLYGEEEKYLINILK